jgi:hypothetical protein
MEPIAYTRFVPNNSITEPRRCATKAEEYLTKAAEYKRRAKAATDPTVRRDFESLADQWRYLASLAQQRDG